MRPVAGRRSQSSDRTDVTGHQEVNRVDVSAVWVSSSTPVTKREKQMNKTTLMAAIVLAAASGSITATAGEPSGAELWKTKGCLGCHDKDTKKVGPAFKDVAAKNPGKAALVEKLKDGKGHMKINASDAEINSMVDAVLATK
jgi:cytochrome c